MGFKENLKRKIHLDRIYRKAVYTIKDPNDTPRWVDKELTREILAMTDFEYKKEGNLPLYIRAPGDDTMEVLVLDNELPIYHTSVEDVVLRKNPHWQEMFSIRNIRKIMNDQDVVKSRGRDSLERLYAVALDRLDLTYTRDDISSLLDDARMAFDMGSSGRITESLHLFLELLGFEPVSFDVLEPDLQFFGRPVGEGAGESIHEHLIVFSEETPSLGLKKGIFSPAEEVDEAWVARYAQGAEPPDLRGVAVFEFLARILVGREQDLPFYSTEERVLPPSTG